MQTRDYWPVPSNSSAPALGDSESIHMDDMAGGNQTDEESHFQGSFSVPGFSPGLESHLQDDAMRLGPSEPSSGMQDDHREQFYEDPHPREQSLKDFREFLFGAKGSTDKGNWTDLLATSLNWMVFDFAFYILGVNSSRLIPNIFKTSNTQTSYSRLTTNGWHTLVATCIGAVTGGAIAIKVMHNFSRRKIQMWSFLALAALFVVLGVLYITLLGKSSSAVIVVVYVICQLVFNVGESVQCPNIHLYPAHLFFTGPNTTTFIVSGSMR